MSFEVLDLGPSTLYQLGAAAVVAVLLLLLIASFASRSRVFCQYLHRAHLAVLDFRDNEMK